MRAQRRPEHGQAAEDSDDRGGPDGDPPISTAEERDQMRARGTQGQRPDQGADQKAPVLEGPSDGNLHAHGIDTCEGCTSKGAQDKRLGAADGDPKLAQIGDSRHEGRDAEDPARIEPVGKTKRREAERTEGEAQLNGSRQPGQIRRGQSRLCLLYTSPSPRDS